MLRDFPAAVRLYDILRDGGEDLRAPSVRRAAAPARSLVRRRAARPARPVAAGAVRELGRAARRCATARAPRHRRADAEARATRSTVAGRPKGPWFKWKRGALTLDTVLMYAQRGHGKRSSFYSDYTFGAWRGDALVPVGKAYSGFTDEELRRLDKWVRDNTVNRFGPVREVAPGARARRSPSTACTARPATNRASRCASRASTASAGTSRSARPTRWRRWSG